MFCYYVFLCFKRPFQVNHFQLDDIKNILGAVGVDTDAEAAKMVISRLQGKSIEEVIAEGSSGLVAVSFSQKFP